MRVRCSRDRCIIYVGVHRVLDEILGEPNYRRFTAESGRVLHARLGFDNDVSYRRWYQSLDGKTYVLLSGVPDRIQPPYVDELKTTIHGREKYVEERAYYQLQLYMFLTGLKYGRLYIYYKDTKDLVLKNMWSYNSNVVRETLEAFIQIVLTRYGFRETIRKRTQQNR